MKIKLGECHVHLSNYAMVFDIGLLIGISLIGGPQYKFGSPISFILSYAPKI